MVFTTFFLLYGIWIPSTADLSASMPLRCTWARSRQYYSLSVSARSSSESSPLPMPPPGPGTVEVTASFEASVRKREAGPGVREMRR